MRLTLKTKRPPGQPARHLYAHFLRPLAKKRKGDEGPPGALIALGHRNLVLLGGQPGTSVAEDRVAGFRAELEAAGIAWSRERLAMSVSRSGAFGAMNALQASGIESGRDVGVVCIGEAAAFHPALTTVLDNPATIGRMAAELLLRRIADPGMAPEHLTLEPKLVIRECCGDPR